VGKHIDFLTRRRWLDGLSASVLGNAAPRVRNVSIEQVRIETMNDRPGAGAETDNLFALPRPTAARPLDDELINAIGRKRSDRFTNQSLS